MQSCNTNQPTLQACFAVDLYSEAKPLHCWEYEGGNSRCVVGATVLVAEGYFLEGCSWPPNGLKSIKVAAVHIHNTIAKLTAKGPAITHHILRDLHDIGVNIVHADFNGMAKRTRTRLA